MRNASCPEPESIREWAYDPDAIEPVQDWDLVISHLPYDELYVELAADNTCPKWEYFMGLMYLIAGDAVRTGYRSESKERVEHLISCTESIPRHRFHLLRTRYREICSHPEKFDYDDWELNGWVVRDREAAEG